MSFVAESLQIVMTSPAQRTWAAAEVNRAAPGRVFCVTFRGWSGRLECLKKRQGNIMLDNKTIATVKAGTAAEGHRCAVDAGRRSSRQAIPG